MLIVIPARGGSKRVKNKNMRKVGGHPLLYYTIRAAQLAYPKAKIVVSSDSAQILEFAEKSGVESLMRNEELAKDSVHSFYVCQDAYNRLEVADSELVIMLLPTSPLRTAASIQGCVNLLKGDVESVISAVKSPIQPGQLWVKKGLDYVQLFSGREKNTQSQDWEKTYCINGSIYVGTVKTLKKYQSFYSQKLVLYEMSEEESLDINTEREFEILEKLL